MKKAMFIKFFLSMVISHCSMVFVFAQLNDAQWMLGPGTSRIDFRTDPPVIDSIRKAIGTDEANSTVSNINGEMLYYTNGLFIAGKMSDGDSILNGNGLNPCSFTNQYYNGLPFPQADLFLPMPGNPRYYYLFHFSGDKNNGIVFTLYYSIVDKEGNFGLGEVVTKNDTFYQAICRSGGMAACKHANGRDWWVVVPQRITNGYYKFLLSVNGITDTLHQQIGPTYLNLDQSYSRFSLDGTKYLTSTWTGLINVMDFDRCTGEFSNSRTINNSEQGVGMGGMAEFSPNGRFVYATNTAKLEQYDLDNPNIQDSVLLYRQSGAQPASTSQLSVALDGRLYASTWAGGFYFLSVINFPDELGLNCNFVYGGQPTLSDNSINVSNTANPRLGPLVGSGCDTIPTGIRQHIIDNKQPRILPNPADKSIYIEMPAQGNYLFKLVNETGQVVETRETKQVDIINTQGVESGIYFLSVKDFKSNKFISSQKVVVQH